ncbi:MAG: EamA family transporter [Patescibacteria group bacterium]
MSWLVYAIGAQFFYTISTFVDRFLIEKRVNDTVTLTILSGSVSFVIGLAVFAFQGLPLFSVGQTILIILGGAIIEFAFLPYYKAILMDDPSRVVPIYQTIPLFVLALSFIFIGETLTPVQAGGFALILVGSFVLALKKLGMGVFRLRKSFWLMIASSLMVAIALVVFKFVVDIQGFWDTLAYEFIGAGFGALILFSLPGQFSKMKGTLKGVAGKTAAVIGANELLWIAARLSSFFASSLAPVSLVAIVGGVQPLLIFLGGTFLSIWFPNILKEDLDGSVVKLKIAAIILVFFGVWLINI